MKIIRLAIDETYQEMLLTALMEKVVSCAGTPAEKGYKMLYGDVKEAIAQAKEIRTNDLRSIDNGNAGAKGES